MAQGILNLHSLLQVVSLQVFFGIQDLQRDNLTLASRSCIQELPLLALDGQKVPGSLMLLRGSSVLP